MAGIYVHIPFCRQACSYCDFHFSTSLANKTPVVEAIISEAALRADYLKGDTVESVYFGGGTPSLLSAQELAGIFSALNNHFSITGGAEITLEANPDDISRKVLKDWLAIGVNRLSIGLQSFSDAELRWMNRAHTAAESLASVKEAQDAGFNDLSIDLIYGSKFQTLAGWENTLLQATALQTPHVSSYNLTIEKKTALGVNLARGREPAVDEGLSSRQFLMMSEILGQSGFIHYEISNFAKEGFFAKHNSSYWLRKPYIGLGPSAHSFNGSSRQWNVSNNNIYIRALREKGVFFEKEDLSMKQQYNEYVLTRLRTIWGCDEGEINRLFGGNYQDQFLKSAEKNKAFLVRSGAVYTLNMEGKLRADGIASDFFLL